MKLRCKAKTGQLTHQGQEYEIKNHLVEVPDEVGARLLTDVPDFVEPVPAGPAPKESEK